jgi:cell fate regulator YaaT (PSP1 superfamily)
MNDESTKPQAIEAPLAAAANHTSESRFLTRVRFVVTGRVLDCESGELVLRKDEEVIADDRRMGGLAKVLIGTCLRPAKGPIGRVIRRAESRDRERTEQEIKRQVEVMAYARERARAYELPIKFFRVELGQSGDRSLFYFSSEQRVDFRALVRDLASYLRGRIELRQVGVREESKMTGGIGTCGCELCCAGHFTHFAPVSIKMAKNQHLVLNPTKIAGQCSRLKCCLAYEDAVYIEHGKGLPKTGKRVDTPDGMGRVDDVDVLRRRVRVSFPEAPPKTYEADEIRLLNRPSPSEEVTPEPVILDKLSDSDVHPLNGDEEPKNKI